MAALGTRLQFARAEAEVYVRARPGQKACGPPILATSRQLAVFSEEGLQVPRIRLGLHGGATFQIILSIGHLCKEGNFNQTPLDDKT